jgi:hypothetical protein
LRQQDHGELQEHRIGVSSLTAGMDTLKQYPTTAVVAVSKQQQPSAKACHQQRLTTSRGRRELTQAINRQGLTTFPTAYPMQPSRLSNYIHLLAEEAISSPNRGTASKTEYTSCLLAISDQFCKILYAVIFC